MIYLQTGSVPPYCSPVCNLLHQLRRHKCIPGTLQSSKINSQVLDPLMPSLSSFCAVENPGIPYRKVTYTHFHYNKTIINDNSFIELVP